MYLNQPDSGGIWKGVGDEMAVYSLKTVQLTPLRDTTIYGKKEAAANVDDNMITMMNSKISKKSSWVRQMDRPNYGTTTK